MGYYFRIQENFGETQEKTESHGMYWDLWGCKYISIRESGIQVPTNIFDPFDFVFPILCIVRL